MVHKSSRNASLGALAAVLAPILVMTGGAQAGFIFGQPANLGPTINSLNAEYDASLSTDGSELYFSSNRPGGHGGVDIWVAKRTDKTADWSVPVNVGPVVNSPYNEYDSGISADGLMLYFASDRPGGYGAFDIWVTTRVTAEGDWGEPVNLEPAVNTPYADTDPRLSTDGLSLYFSSSRPGGLGSLDIWMVTRPVKDAPWESPVNLGAPVNSLAKESNLSISADGLALFFSEDLGGPLRPGGLGDADLWVTSRATAGSPWGIPANLGPAVNSPYEEDDPSISNDGSWLIFNSARPGGFGDYDLWGAKIAPAVDLNRDERIDFRDFGWLGQRWRGEDTLADVAPLPLGDAFVDFRDLSALTQYWLQGAAPPIYITWLGHASVKVAWMDQVIYIDPLDLTTSPHDATLILVSHDHTDHYSTGDISKVSGAATQFIAAASVIQKYGRGQAIAPGGTITLPKVRIIAVAAYNLTKTNHPKSSNWVGFIVELGSKRIYCAGDTDLTPEMKALTDIDVAFLPAGGTYTMTAAEAADATRYFKPGLAIPYHWGRSVGTLADAQLFARSAACNAKVMTKGETISSDDWNKDFSIAAYWKLDEATGNVARDSNGSNHATLNGGPVWKPAGGKVGGALEFDGVDDYVSTPFVLNPSAGSFSVFAWIKGGTPGHVILSQQNVANWLMADASDGTLSTELKGAGRTGKPLKSSKTIVDGEWHRVGLTSDGTTRILYVDNVEAVKDTQPGLIGSTGGLYIGAGSTLAAGSFWSGLIDDVCIYNRAVKP